MTVKKVLAIVFVLLFLGTITLYAQGPATAVTSFTYQGRLVDEDGPVNNTCDLRFSLWDAATGGTQVGTPQTVTGVSVSDGYFSVSLDFGDSVFNGQERYLQVSVRCPAGEGDYTLLDGRVALGSTPYALYARRTSWEGLLDVPGDFADDSDNDTLATLDCDSGQVPAWNGSTWECGSGGSGDAWLLAGNAATTAGTDFVGTTDDEPLELHVNGERALRLEPGSSPNVVGGHSSNSVGNISGATIGGGGNGQIAGGNNDIDANYGTIGGGHSNRVATTAVAGSVSGGVNNRAAGQFTAVGGGQSNVAGANSSGPHATVGGGFDNSATGGRATIAGGTANSASGNNSTIAGGENNSTPAEHAAVGGGIDNEANAASSSVAGGNNNVATDPYSTVGGGASNQAGNGPQTVFSNEGYATVAGGEDNTASGVHSAIGGGQSNTAGGELSTISGGVANSTADPLTTIGGGTNNSASGYGATIGGGESNVVSATSATVPGGRGNEATGSFSFAAGHEAHAIHSGSFVWSDAASLGFPELPELFSTGEDQFVARASGGVWFFTNVNLTTGVTLPAGSGSWSNLSDAAVKENMAAVDGRRILQTLSQLPIATWNYTSQDPDIRHIGPTAQDFRAAFGLGEDAQHISSVDADGVSLAAIQGLYQMVQEQDAQIAAQAQQIAAQQEQIEALLQETQQGPQRAAVPWWLGLVLLLAGIAWFASKRIATSRGIS